MSYHGRLGYGLLGDYDAMPDLEALAAHLRDGDRGAAPRPQGCRPPAASRRAPAATAARAAPGRDRAGRAS